MKPSFSHSPAAWPVCRCLLPKCLLDFSCCWTCSFAVILRVQAQFRRFSLTAYHNISSKDAESTFLNQNTTHYCSFFFFSPFHIWGNYFYTVTVHYLNQILMHPSISIIWSVSPQYNSTFSVSFLYPFVKQSVLRCHLENCF